MPKKSATKAAQFIVETYGAAAVTALDKLSEQKGTYKAMLVRSGALTSSQLYPRPYPAAASATHVLNQKRHLGPDCS